MKYILIDTMNLYHRATHMVDPKFGIDSMIGMSQHLIFSSLNKEWNTWSPDHAIFFTEGRSWRKELYPDYKANRKVEFAKKSEKEQEEQKQLLESYSELIEYLRNNTNATVIQNPIAEADDMIAIWVEDHCNDKNILISSDSDFIQLLRFDNLTIYDPIKDITITKDGITDDNGNNLEFNLTSTAKIKIIGQNKDFRPEPNWFEYALFLKCIRGDITDNIFSAYPKVREKGTKNSVGIREAFNDRSSKGYSWNNFFQQRWVDHNGNEQKVKETYEFNKKLIDLSEIPDIVKIDSKRIIEEAIKKPQTPALEIGHQFMKYCGRFKLEKISNNPQSYINILKGGFR